ncbi:MAG: GNAT family N-acetyltransferase [Mesorhizobium sp.]|uniref:acyl-homoserine-lactone synthase n=1 Tax=Mesorhizobium sp. TaxID=1871066 RepID=UPI000FE5B432|nr:acyl-homoserine-lactone synthase TraI [Mesorhizobium sp.]RWF83197.1 MAG: GNAT family N-acetyltransferase [Mesorhizobium sp.]RWG04521.1 MAG: GNAT family N-acetyltransferase [Mesorhizobium sp.]RWG90592.1 MAG: GNAT family N-acetyltransferase [Mesorhizobium sp.]RWH07462.1 MAG: GNAT family N-acetyltransferase [Mesorhizobium sp.]RWH08475.1 MAG: GNAT family N-acetyltransferase [Mesorhizobium sp.]
MRALAIPADAHDDFPDLIDSMHRLRARIFKGRLGWDVVTRGGRETDEFDALRPTYILAISSASEVVGCARLLPASGPNMIEALFPDLVRSGAFKPHSAVIESSRFCVDTSLDEGRAGGSLHDATLTMFAAIIEWSMVNGYRQIVTGTDLRIERILKRAGWPMRRIGQPRRIGETTAIAGMLPADRASFERVCPPSYRSVLCPKLRAA